ncbi:MAG: acyltransferase [archaeon]
MQEENKKRLGSIDLLRVLAIVLVLIFHIIYEFTYNNTLRYIGFVGISLFFIVSGFLLAKNHPKSENFSLKWFAHRYIKIAPLYYLSLVMIVLLFFKQTFSGAVLKNLLYHFLFIDFISEQTAYAIISPAWFLIPLIGLYILFPYLNRIMKRAPATLLILFALMSLLRFTMGTLTGFSPFFFVGEFCFGILLAHNKRHPALLSALITAFIMPIMALPYLIFYVVYYFKISTPSHVITSFIGANTLALFLFHESFMKVALGKWVVFSLSPFLGLIALAFATFLTITISRKLEEMALSSKSLKATSEIKGHVIVVVLLIFVGLSTITLANTMYQDVSFSPSEKSFQKTNLLVSDVYSEKTRSKDNCQFTITGKVKNLGQETAITPTLTCREIAYPLREDGPNSETIQLEGVPPGQQAQFEMHTTGSCTAQRFECTAN